MEYTAFIFMKYKSHLTQNVNGIILVISDAFSEKSWKGILIYCGMEFNNMGAVMISIHKKRSSIHSTHP